MPTRRAAATTPSRAGTCPMLGALVVAGALLVDYVMTVAVSTASAVEQVISAVPELHDWKLVDRRRCDRPDHDRQPSRACASPGTSSPSRPTCSWSRRCTMIAIGVFRVVVNGEGAPPVLADRMRRTATPGRRASCCMIRAFASGSVALTGTEAIANGVPAFKPPEPKNAADDPRRRGDPAGLPVPRHHLRRGTRSASCRPARG